MATSQTKWRDGFGNKTHPSLVIDDSSCKPRVPTEVSATMTMMEAISNGSRSPLATPVASNRNATAALRNQEGRFHQPNRQDNNVFRTPRTCPACGHALIYHKVTNRDVRVEAAGSRTSDGIGLVDSVITTGITDLEWSFDETQGTPDAIPMYNDSTSRASYTAPAPPPLSNECSFLMPLESLLDALIETYCEAIQENNHEEQNKEKMMRRRRRQDQQKQRQKDENVVVDGSMDLVATQRNPLRMLPPFCPYCKTYIVMETFLDNYYQEELLSNLATWLAQSFSQDSSTQDEQTPSRPSHGSILVVLDNKSTTQPSRSSGYAPSTHAVTPTIETAASTTTSISTEQKRRSAIDFFVKLKEQAVHQASKAKSPPPWDEDWKEKSPAEGSVGSRIRGSLSPMLSSYGSPCQDDKWSHASQSSKWSEMILESVKPPQHSVRTRTQQDPPVRTESIPNDRQDRYFSQARGKSWEDPSLPVTSSRSFGRERRDDDDDETLVYSVSNEEHRVLVRQPADKTALVQHQTTSPQGEVEIQRVSTIEEERMIIGDYTLTRGIATKAIGKKLMEGFLLTSVQCKDCHMPLMARDGKAACVVCPIVAKKAKKRAQKLREAIHMAWTQSPKSDYSSLPEFEVLETVPPRQLANDVVSPTTFEPVLARQRGVFSGSDAGTPPISPTESNFVHVHSSGKIKISRAVESHNRQSPDPTSPVTLSSQPEKELLGSQLSPRQSLGQSNNLQTTDGQRSRENNPLQHVAIGQNPSGASPLTVDSPKPGPEYVESNVKTSQQHESESDLSTPTESPVRGHGLTNCSQGGLDRCPYSAIGSSHTTISSIPSVTNSSLATYSQRERDTSKHRIRRTATNEVLQRLQNGWQMTSSQCSSCRAPLMQSTTGEIDCVFCQATEATSPKSQASPRPSEQDKSIRSGTTRQSPIGQNESDLAPVELQRSPCNTIQRANSPLSASGLGNPTSPIQSSSRSRDTSPLKRPPTSPPKASATKTTETLSTPLSPTSSRTSRAATSVASLESHSIPKQIVAHQSGQINNAKDGVASQLQHAMTKDSHENKAEKKRYCVSGATKNPIDVTPNQGTFKTCELQSGEVGGGVRYLAIPEGLDLDDDKAVLSMLAELRRSTTSAEQKRGNSIPDESKPPTAETLDRSSNGTGCDTPEIRKWSEVVALSLRETEHHGQPALRKNGSLGEAEFQFWEADQSSGDLSHSFTWDGASFIPKSHYLSQNSRMPLDFQRAGTCHDGNRQSDFDPHPGSGGLSRQQETSSDFLNQNQLRSTKHTTERLTSKEPASDIKDKCPLLNVTRCMADDGIPPVLPQLSYGRHETKSVRSVYAEQDSVIDIVEGFSKDLQILTIEDQSVFDNADEDNRNVFSACPVCLQKLDGSRDNSFCGNRKCKFFMVPSDVMEFFSGSSEDFVLDDDDNTSQKYYGSSATRSFNNDNFSFIRPESTSVSESSVSLPSSNLRLRFSSASESGSPESARRLSSELAYAASRDLTTKSFASTISPDPSDPLSPAHISSYRLASGSNRLDASRGTNWNERLLQLRSPLSDSGAGERSSHSSRTVHELVDRLAMAAKALKDLEHSVSRAENSSTASSDVLSSVSSIRGAKMNI